MKFFIPGMMLMGMFAIGQSGYEHAKNLKLNIAQLQSVGNGGLGYHL